MKKYASSIGAVILAICLYSFMQTKSSTPLKAAENLYWFQVLPGEGANPSFLDNEVTFISGPSTIIPAGTNCEGLTKKCVVGFQQKQLVAPAYNHVNENMGSNPQAPRPEGRERSTL